jgi:hypothetical protein
MTKGGTNKIIEVRKYLTNRGVKFPSQRKL